MKDTDTKTERERMDDPLAQERNKRMRFKPHTADCYCSECEGFLTGWDMGFAHAYMFGQRELKHRIARELREILNNSKNERLFPMESMGDALTRVCHKYIEKLEQELEEGDTNGK